MKEGSDDGEAVLILFSTKATVSNFITRLTREKLGAGARSQRRRTKPALQKDGVTKRRRQEKRQQQKRQRHAKKRKISVIE